MGDVYQSSYTTTIPENATIKGETVTWHDKRGNKKTGKLTTGKQGEQKVLIRNQKWIARFRDENGIEHQIATGCKNKDAATHFLHQKEMEVERIKSGVLSRSDLNTSSQLNIPIQTHLDAFDTNRQARGITQRQINDVRGKLNEIFNYLDVKSLSDLNADNVDRYIVYRQKEQKANQTINNDLSALRSFCRWCLETNRLAASPMRAVKQLSRTTGKKFERRALTDREIQLLLEAVKKRRGRGQDRRKERELIYKTFLGTGLRSSELASITVGQVTATHIILTPPSEKNRKGAYQPITPELAERLKQWIDETGKTSQDQLFVFDKHSIKNWFEADCRMVGITKVDERGQHLVVHSFRKTFGTKLARAGVPLTTTQRLMRHSTPELTARYYIDVTPIDMAEALAKIQDYEPS